MFVMRDEQIRLLARAAFDQWMESHSRDFFPERCAVLGTIELRRTIQHALERAQHYGFVRNTDRCRYVDIAVLLGAHFDEDPTLTWASAILKDTAFKDSSTRMEMLHDAACEHLRRLEHPPDLSQIEESEPDEIGPYEQESEEQESEVVEQQDDQVDDEDEVDEEDVTQEEEVNLEEENEETNGG